MKTGNYHRAILLCLLFFFCMLIPGYAHDVVGELENMRGTEAAGFYLGMGYKHILPLGWDHILFILGLFLLSSDLKTLLWQSFSFTVAHSITLILATYSIIYISPAIVEPLIALSIVYIALENIFTFRFRTSRLAVIFVFGLVHGMGFAGALKEMGLPGNLYFSSLLFFNAGVELGQLTVIMAAFLIIAAKFSGKIYYRKYIVTPLSLCIALIAGFWFIERTF